MVVYAEVSDVAQGPPFIYACAGINKKTWLLNITDILVFKTAWSSHASAQVSNVACRSHHLFRL